MSENGQKKRQQSDTTNHEESGFYVYCVAGTKPAQELTLGDLPTAIEDDAKIELVSSGNLSAVVSRVPMSAYSETSLAENLTDATWTAVRAMRHEHVVEFFSKNTSVVPLRFGTIYLDRSGVEKMLSDKSDQLAAIIQRLEGHEEWGVNVYSDRSVLLDNIVIVSSRLREMSDTAAQASPGQSYLLQKKIDAMRIDEAKTEIKRIVENIEDGLQKQSRDRVRLRILKVETTEHGELKAKFAFLVKKKEFDKFRNTAEELAREYESSGTRLELTGPWPPYNFATEPTVE